ncbi:hypothetical protein AM501_02945, partial [Aneurinibacillus migulanus]
SNYDYVFNWEEADSTKRPEYSFHNPKTGPVKFEVQQYSVNDSYTDVRYTIKYFGKDVAYFDVEGNYTGDDIYYKDIDLEIGNYTIQVINLSRTDGPGEGDYARAAGQIRIQKQ